MAADGPASVEPLAETAAPGIVLISLLSDLELEWSS